MSRAAIVGVISDTHGLLRPEAIAALRGSDLIVHAGDVGAAAVLDGLRELAPVAAVRGNNDHGPWAAGLPESHLLEVNGVWLYILHDLSGLDIEPRAAGCAAVIAGHSHQPRIETKGGVLYVNPGSAGPRRFTLPVAVARLRIAAGRVEAEAVDLSLGAPDPR